MRISGFWKPIEEILDIFILRLKVVFRDGLTLIALLISVILFAILVQYLTVTAMEYSSLPIGVIDYDQSTASKELIHNLKQVKTFRIQEGEEQHLQKLLLDEMITSLFIIEEGYERNLIQGKLIDIITMRYKEDNKSMAILSDIFAAEVLYRACYYKSFHYYDKLTEAGTGLSLPQYQEYLEELIQREGEFDFAFQFKVTNPESDHKVARITNTVIYQQLIYGIIGLMMGLNAMFLLSQIIEEKEKGLVDRLDLSGYHHRKRDLGNLFAVLVWQTGLALLFTLLLRYHLNNLDIRDSLAVFLLMVLNSLVLGEIMLLISKFVRRISLYQMYCTALLLITGAFGFYRLVSGFYLDKLDNLTKFIPNSWFIKGLTDIMIYNYSQDILNEGHRTLLCMAVSLIIIIIGIDLFQDFHIINRKKRIGRTLR